eukprot:6383766-Amphidinium_carterae.1
MAPMVRGPCRSHDSVRGPDVVLHGHFSDGSVESVKDPRSGPVGQHQSLTVVRQGHLLFGQPSTPVANRGRWQTEGVRQVSFGRSRPLEPLSPERVARREGVVEWLRERAYDGAFRKSVTGSAPPNIVFGAGASRPRTYPAGNATGRRNQCVSQRELSGTTENR